MDQTETYPARSQELIEHELGSHPIRDSESKLLDGCGSAEKTTQQHSDRLKRLNRLLDRVTMLLVQMNCDEEVLDRNIKFRKPHGAWLHN
jgi:hypothetical protein